MPSSPGEVGVCIGFGGSQARRICYRVLRRAARPRAVLSQSRASRREPHSAGTIKQEIDLPGRCVCLRVWPGILVCQASVPAQVRQPSWSRAMIAKGYAPRHGLGVPKWICRRPSTRNHLAPMAQSFRSGLQRARHRARAAGSPSGGAALLNSGEKVAILVGAGALPG